MITVLCANTGLDKTYEVDGFEVGGFHHPGRMRTAPGGKGINVARVLKALGHDVVVTGFAGGTIARYCAGYLRREGITPKFVPVAEESRLCINIIDRASRTQTRLDEVGPLVTPTEIDQLRHTWDQLGQQSQLMVASGSAPRGVPFDFYGELVLTARKHGVPTILDAHDEWLRDGVKASPTVIKPNLAELSTLFQQDLSVPAGVVEASQRLLQLGVQAVICSLGGDGAVVVTGRHGRWRAYAPKVEAISPVGSGDAMVAGFAAAWADRRPLADRIRWAVASGAASAATFGAGFANKSDIEALVPLVGLEPLDERPDDPAPPSAENTDIRQP